MDYRRPKRRRHCRFEAELDHPDAFESVTELAAAAMGFEYLLKILRDFLVTVREGQIEG
jgi:hypothetical protein